jgi:hypothetical protein
MRQLVRTVIASKTKIPVVSFRIVRSFREDPLDRIGTGGERATSVAIVLVELDEGPGAQMDMGRGIRALRVAVALELVVSRHPGRALWDHSTPADKCGPARVGWYPSGGCPRCPRGPLRAALFACEGASRSTVTLKPGVIDLLIGVKRLAIFTERPRWPSFHEPPRGSRLSDLLGRVTPQFILCIKLVDPRICPLVRVKALSHIGEPHLVPHVTPNRRLVGVLGVLALGTSASAECAWVLWGVRGNVYEPEPPDLVASLAPVRVVIGIAGQPRTQRGQSNDCRQCRGGV